MKLRRRLTVVGAAAIAALTVAVPAYAFWSASGAGSIAAAATSLEAATSVSASATGDTTATVTWANGSNPSGTTYSVTDGSTTYCSAASASPCTVTGLTPNTSYTFAVIPILQGWTGPSTSAPSVTTSKTSPALSITAPSAGTAGTAMAASAITGTLSGGTSPTGSVSFTVFGPQTSAPTSCATGGTAVGTAVTVSGNGTYHPSASFTPTAGGKYWWYASYDGDTHNSATASTCGADMTETDVTGNTLVITSSAVSGAASSSPNLGAITVQRTNGLGGALTPGTPLTVSLSSTSSHGKFGTSQFGSALSPAQITIPASQSSATFWYGDTATGSPTITASASGFTSATQTETITTAPAGLAITVTGGSGSQTPVASCGTVSTSYTCSVTGTGNSGSVTFTVQFVNASGNPVVYSATQPSTITETTGSGGNLQTIGSTVIAADASTSPSASPLTASHSGNSAKTSTLSFGPYSLAISVGS